VPAPNAEPAPNQEPEGVPEEACRMGTELQQPPDEEPPPTPRRGLIARLFGWDRERAVSADAPVWVAGAPEPAAAAEPAPEAPQPEPPPPAEPDPTQAILEDALEALGSAHHRPFSRG
jgi:hypothetical protein